MYVGKYVSDCHKLQTFQGNADQMHRVITEHLDYDMGLALLVGRAKGGADWNWAGLVALGAWEGESWDLNS